jgi:hypothetical protein
MSPSYFSVLCTFAEKYFRSKDTISKILAKDNRPYRLLIRESLAIQQQQPEFNKTISSIPLIAFPDGLTGF